MKKRYSEEQIIGFLCWAGDGNRSSIVLLYGKPTPFPAPVAEHILAATFWKQLKPFQGHLLPHYGQR